MTPSERCPGLHTDHEVDLHALLAAERETRKQAIGLLREHEQIKGWCDSFGANRLDERVKALLDSQSPAGSEPRGSARMSDDAGKAVGGPKTGVWAEKTAGGTCDHDFPTRDGRCVGCGAGIEETALELDRLRAFHAGVVAAYDNCMVSGPGGKPLGPIFFGQKLRRLFREAVDRVDGKVPA